MAGKADYEVVEEGGSWRALPAPGQPDLPAAAFETEEEARRWVAEEAPRVAADVLGSLAVTFFNQPFRERQLPPGTEVALSGKVERFRGRLQMKAPVVDVLGGAGHRRTGRIVPGLPDGGRDRLLAPGAVPGQRRGPLPAHRRPAPGGPGGPPRPGRRATPPSPGSTSPRPRPRPRPPGPAWSSTSCSAWRWPWPCASAARSKRRRASPTPRRPAWWRPSWRPCPTA